MFKLAILGGLLIAAVGLFQMYSGASVVLTAVQSKNWPIARALITESSIHYGANGTTISVTYDYRVGDRKLAGASVYPGDTGFSSRYRTGRVDAYPAGSTHVVHYSPSDPSMAFLETGIYPHTFLPLMFGFVFFSAGLLFGIIGFLAPKYGQREPSGGYYFPMSSPVSKIGLCGMIFIGIEFFLMYFLDR